MHTRTLLLALLMCVVGCDEQREDDTNTEATEA